MPAERDRLARQLVKQRDYLAAVVERMRALEFPAGDPLLLAADKALAGVQSMLETAIEAGRR